ncbi:MAG: MlaD family protein [Prevotellaceae bacterium]|jgi:phospholipid/cholesterol/gamma-HCH transport system substrate-binding protein|nr:MlaD family protein [Prevotellaceae bacterium]
MKITKEIKIGIYFALTLTALVWGVNFLKGIDLFNKVNVFYAVYENVEGLQTTSNVYIKGMKTGVVSKIKLERNERFIVELKIRSKYSIPSNSTAYIYSADIMGTKSIKIKPGNSDTFLKNGDMIESGYEVDMFSMLMDDLPSIKDSLKITIRELDMTFRNINKLLSDENIDNLSKGISSMEKTMSNLAQFSATFNQHKSSIVNSLNNIEAITGNFKNNGEEINSIIKNMSDLSDSLKRLELGATVNEMKAILGKISSGDGSLGKIIYSDSLHSNLSNSLNSLDALLTDLRENPKRYINISVFGRKSK